MQQKYRVYLVTTRGSQWVASGSSVNGLVRKIVYWFNNTSAGRAVYDDMVQSVIVSQWNTQTRSYIAMRRARVNDREDVVRKVRALGGR